MFSEFNGVPTQNLPPSMYRFMDGAVKIVNTEEQGRGLQPDVILYEMIIMIIKVVLNVYYGFPLISLCAHVMFYSLL